MNRHAARVRCGALRRDGNPCEALSVPGKTRCRFHGGASTGPRTETGKTRSLANLKQYRTGSSVSDPVPQHGPQAAESAGDSLLRPLPPTAIPTDKGTEMTKQHTDTAAQIELRQAALANEQDAAEAAFEQASNELGDAAYEGDREKMTKASERVTHCKQELLRLQAARGALERRLVAARESEAAAARDERWDAFAEALDHRHELFAEAEKLAVPFFAAVSAAVDAATEAERVAPIREKVLTPDGWAVMPDFFKSMGEMHKNDMPSVKQALCDMTARSRTYGAIALNLREFDKPDAITRYDDPRAKVVPIEPLNIQES